MLESTDLSWNLIKTIILTAQPRCVTDYRHVPDEKWNNTKHDEQILLSLSLSQLSPHINRSHPFSRFAFFIIGKDHLKFSKHDFISFRANIDTRNIRGIIIEFRLFESDSSLPFSIEREREETKRGKEDRLKTRSL